MLTGALSPGGVEGAPAQDTTPWCSRGGRGARDTAPPLDRECWCWCPQWVWMPCPDAGPLTGVSLRECRDRGSPSRGTGEARWGWRGQGDREHWGSVGGRPTSLKESRTGERHWHGLQTGRGWADSASGRSREAACYHLPQGGWGTPVNDNRTQGVIPSQDSCTDSPRSNLSTRGSPGTPAGQRRWDDVISTQVGSKQLSCS